MRADLAGEAGDPWRPALVGKIRDRESIEHVEHGDRRFLEKSPENRIACRRFRRGYSGFHDPYHLAHDDVSRGTRQPDSALASTDACQDARMDKLHDNLMRVVPCRICELGGVADAADRVLVVGAENEDVDCDLALS